MSNIRKNKENIIDKKSYVFALRVIKACQYLCIEVKNTDIIHQNKKEQCPAIVNY